MGKVVVEFIRNWSKAVCVFGVFDGSGLQVSKRPR